MSTQKYSKQDVIDALQSIAEEIDKSLTQIEYRRNKKDHHPSISWMKDNLGCWNNAKELAGLDLNPSRFQYSEEDAIDAVQSIAEEIGKSPSRSEYTANRRDEDPSVSWISHRFKSWNDAKELAGLDVNAGNDYYDKKDCIDAIQWVAEEINKSPSRDEYDKNKKDHHPSRTVIENIFGSWNDAKDVTGLKLYDEYNKKEKELFTQNIKKHLQCRECGFEKPDGKLNFHHVERNTKVGTISEIVNGKYSIEELKTEVKKCEVLCDSCLAHEYNDFFTEGDCIDAIQSVAEKIEEIPTVQQYKENKKDKHPSIKTISRRLNSWSDAKETVNLEPTQTKPQSDFASPSRNDT